MRTIFLFAFPVYLAGFAATLWLNSQMPVTPALALARSALWPYWLLGGLKGVPLPMD